MKLKIKNLNWQAGRPLVILNSETAKKMNIFVDDRVFIRNDEKFYAVVDIFSNLVKENEIGISSEMSKVLKIKNKSWVEVTPSEDSSASRIIKKKFNGFELNDKELEFLISEIVHNNLTEAEIAYFTAAQRCSGMNKKETIGLTKAMVKTGNILKFKGKYIADKHCIGGIAGNRTTPIVVCICAAAGLVLPKTSSRAITSASGTADVIETISNVELDIGQIKKVVSKTGACLAWGGSLGLAPSDDKIIRVERLLGIDVQAQLLASIISKKISAGSKYILIDIPYGRGSKMETLKKAKNLGEKFIEIGKSFKLKIKVVYTKGHQPIGNGMGPVLEMRDVLEVLRNSAYAPKDLREKSIYLASELMKLCGIKNSKKKAEEILRNGEALQKFKQIVQAQNEKDNFEEKIGGLRLARIKKTIRAKRSGRISYISNHGINSLARILGSPETISSGVYLHKHLGNVKRGDELVTLYSESRLKMFEAKRFFKKGGVIEIK